MSALAKTSKHGRHAAAYVYAASDAARPAVRSNLKRAATVAAGHPAEWDRYPWHRADVDQLEAVRNRLAAEYRPATVNATVAAIRGVLRRAWHAGDLSRADYERRLDALKVVKGGSAPGRALDMAQVSKLFAVAADDGNAGVRDAALFAVLFGLGLRRAEAAAATLADLDTETWTLTVHGKGRRERLAYLTNGSRDAVKAWLAVRGDDDGPLFRAVSKSGKVLAGGMTGRAVAARVERRSEQAGIGRFSAHVLRRTFATQLLGQGHDLATVAAMMGHSNVNTTVRYDRRGEDAKRAAAATLAVPFQPST